MKIGKKALSLVLAFTMVVSTFVGTAAFAASSVHDSDTPWFDSNVSDSNDSGHIVDSNNAWTNVDFKDSSYDLKQGLTINLAGEIQVTKADGSTEILDSSYIVSGSWESSEGFATVDQDGLVKAVAAGETTITVEVKGTQRGTDDAYKDSNRSVIWELSCIVTVSSATPVDVPVTKVTLNKTTLSLEKDAKEKLTATVFPFNATDKNVTWESSSQEIATVDKDGLVTAVAKGSATITATTLNHISAACAVTVTAADPGPGHNNDDGNGGGSSNPGTNPVPSTATFISDTTMDFNVNGTYQFKITSTNGQVPTFVVGTSGVFTTQLVKTVGNDYYFKITAVGQIGAKAGIYVNGQKLLVATVGAHEPTFISDTNNDFTINSTYQIKITSKNGKIPTFAVGTAGVFTTKFISKVGNDYYYKLTAIGQTGAKAGVYVNGVKLLVATVGTSAYSVKCDTTSSFKVKTGASYTFKLTAATKPAFSVGSSNVFKVVLVKIVGNDYFFKATAVGKTGLGSGFYINSGKTPVAAATIS